MSTEPETTTTETTDAKLPPGYRVRANKHGNPWTYYVLDADGHSMSREYVEESEAIDEALWLIDRESELIETNRELQDENAKLRDENIELHGAVEKHVEFARGILRNVPFVCHDWTGDGTLDDAEVDALGRVLVDIGGGEKRHSNMLSMLAMNAACGWIAELDLALGQVRSLTKHGYLGDEPLTMQHCREFEAHLYTRERNGGASPSDAVLDVAVELARLSRGLPREPA